MKISESEVILIVVLVLIGFVLYTSGAMKTTGVKNDDEKHTISSPPCENTPYGCCGEPHNNVARTVPQRSGTHPNYGCPTPQDAGGCGSRPLGCCSNGLIPRPYCR